MVSATANAEGIAARLAALAAQAGELERIAADERQAIARLDADRLIALAESRERIHRAMLEAEQGFQAMLAQAGLAADAPLEALLARLEDAGEASETISGLRAQKQALRDRLARLEAIHAENHVRLRAAFDATTGLLRHLGVEAAPQTYGPAAAGAAR